MPPPHRPGEGTPEGIVRSVCYEVSSRRSQGAGGGHISASDMTWGMMAAFKALNEAGFDIVDRRTGTPVPFVDGHLPYDNQ